MLQPARKPRPFFRSAAALILAAALASGCAPKRAGPYVAATGGGIALLGGLFAVEGCKNGCGSEQTAVFATIAGAGAVIGLVGLYMTYYGIDDGSGGSRTTIYGPEDVDE